MSTLLITAYKIDSINRFQIIDITCISVDCIPYAVLIVIVKLVLF